MGSLGEDVEIGRTDSAARNEWIAVVSELWSRNLPGATSDGRHLCLVLMRVWFEFPDRDDREEFREEEVQKIMAAKVAAVMASSTQVGVYEFDVAAGNRVMLSEGTTMM